MSRYSPGSPILGKGAPLTTAATLNAILESAEEYQLRRQLGVQRSSKSTPLPPDLVKVKNGAGSALRAGEVVEFSNSPLNPLTRGFPWFTGVTPNETRAFAVMLQDLPNDSSAIGLAQISGCCPALVNVQADGDRWAYVTSGQRVPTGDHFWGDVRILVPPDGTGERLCWINIEKSPDSWLGKLTAQPLEKGASGTVNVWEGTPGSETSTGFQITSCYNRSIKIASTTKFVVVNRLHRKKYVSPFEC